MWRLIRGQGLSYGYNIYLKPNEGLLYLSFYEATNIVAAYKEAKSIVVSNYIFGLQLILSTVSTKTKIILFIFAIFIGDSYFRR